MVETNYEILKIHDGATEKEIRKSYRDLVLKFHTDRGGNDEQFKKIKQAYEDLKIGKKYPDTMEERRKKAKVRGLNEQSCDAGVDVADEDAAGHGAEAEAGEVCAAFGGEGADAADLDGDTGEVGEAANSKGADGKAARVEGVLDCGEVEVADEFGEHDSFAEGLADLHAVGPRDAHEVGEGGVDPAEQHIDGHRLGDPGPLLGLGLPPSDSGHARWGVYLD